LAGRITFTLLSGRNVVCRNFKVAVFFAYSFATIINFVMNFYAIDLHLSIDLTVIWLSVYLELTEMLH